jgi:hypothetical protein
MKKGVILFLLGVVFLATLSCNMPWGDSPGANEQTAIAQTVSVQLTASSGNPAASETPMQASSATATPEILPTASPVPSNTPTVTLTPIPCNAAKFISDISFPDDTEMLINNEFVKTWRLQNVGSCSWAPAYQLVFTAGDQMGAPNSQPMTGVVVPPNGTSDVSVSLKAPNAEGVYKALFKLKAADGAIFGIGPAANGPFWVQIKAVAPAVAPVVEAPPLNRLLFLVNPRLEGADVRHLQQRLLDLGYAEVGNADGIFGNLTDNGVRHFQTNNGLNVDGKVGPLTWEALFSQNAQ